MRRVWQTVGIISLFLLLGLSACGQESAQVVETSFTFDADEEDWTGGFADLPLGHEQQGYDVSFSYAEIPVQGAESKGLFLTGNNHSDDLFMYVTGPIRSGGRSQSRHRLPYYPVVQDGD